MRNTDKRAEEINKTLEEKLNFEKSDISGIGFDSLLDKANPLVKMVNNIIDDECDDEAARIVQNMVVEPKKINNIWDRYIPEKPSNSELKAATWVRGDKVHCSGWNQYINDSVIEQALGEEVVYRFLEDLSEINNFMDNEEELIKDWAKKRSGVYGYAKRNADYLVKRCFTDEERKDPEQEDGIHALWLTRMAAYRVLDAHFLGDTKFKNSEKLGGGQYVSVKIKAHFLKEYEKEDRFAARQLGFVRIGDVEDVSYNVPDKAKYSKLFEKILKETNPSDAKRLGIKFSLSHPVQEIAQKICPLLGKEPMYFLQKNMDPKIAYGLYSMAKEMNEISRKSVYPINGIRKNGVPEQIPPGFESRFDKEWMEKKGITLGHLTYTGFIPITNKKVKSKVREVFLNIPELGSNMRSPEILDSLKTSRTVEVVISPIKAALIQKKIIMSFRDSFKPEYDELLKKSMDDVSNENKTEGQYQAEMRMCIFNECINKISNNPEKYQKAIYTNLWRGKETKVTELSIPEEMIWSKDLKLKTKSVAQDSKDRNTPVR